MEFQMRNKTFIPSLVGVTAAVAVAGSANAGIPAFTDAFSPVNVTVTTDAGVGNDLLVFTVGASDIAVTSLGLFNGYDGIRDVGIYAWNGLTNRGTGPALVSGSVTTDYAPNGYTFAACASTVLTAGQQYVVVGQSKNRMASNTAAYADSGAGADITFNSYWYNSDTSLNATPGYPVYSPAYFNANFMFSVVPAPGAIALLGVAGLVGARRRRA
jgi:MYXO-CTERM domain-containing protein